MFIIFKRSARNWKEFAEAEKIEVDKVETYDEAREFCIQWNENRTEKQIEEGTKMEFTKE